MDHHLAGHCHFTASQCPISAPFSVDLSPMPSHSSLAGPTPTFTRLLISGQLVARVAHTPVAAQSVFTALLTPATIRPGALVDLCRGGK